MLPQNEIENQEPQPQATNNESQVDQTPKTVADVFTDALLNQIVEDCKEIIMDDLGRLRKTLDRRCPNCGRPLELRVTQVETIIDGVEALEDFEIIICRNLDYEEEVEVHEKKKRKYKQNSLTEVEDREAKSRKNNARYKKSPGSSRRNGRNRQTGD